MSLVWKVTSAALVGIVVFFYLRLKTPGHNFPLSDISPIYRGYPDGMYVRSNQWLWLYTKTWQVAKPKAVVIVLHGYADHCSRYWELAHVLNEAQITLLTFDFEGHGRSEGDPLYVERFQAYVNNLDAVLKQLPINSKTPVFLLGHQMGSLVALQALMVVKNLKGLILSAPSVEVWPSYNITQHAPEVVLRQVTTRLPHTPIPAVVEPADLVSDVETQEDIRHDPYYFTDVWAKARTLTELREAAQAAPNLISRVTQPLLVLKAADDRVVQPHSADVLLKNARSSDKEMLTYASGNDLYHDGAKQDVMRDIAAWVSEHVDPPKVTEKPKRDDDAPEAA